MNEVGAKPDELRTLLRELIESTNQTLASHKIALERHEQNMSAEHKTVATHHDAIQVLRKDMLGLGELVNAQSKVLTALQSTMLRVLAHLGMMPDEQPPTPPTALN